MMNTMQKIFRGTLFHRVDKKVTNWMADNAITLIRISIGIIFFWFGFLKFFPGLSPAENLAIKTIDTLTLGFFSEQLIIYGLAALESIIGLLLIFNVFLREALLLLFVQMIGTLIPLFLYPGEVFTVIPYGLTLEGQYIVKNLVIISGAIAVGATVRGAKIRQNSEHYNSLNT
ncbi:MAG: DoxX family membrane protein [Bacteroidales bacterium]